MPGKLLTYFILKSGNDSTSSTVKSGKLLTICHWPQWSGKVLTVSTLRSSKLATICTLKSAKLSTNCTLPCNGIPLHMQSAVTGLSDWIKKAAMLINMIEMNFIGIKVI